MNLFIELFVKGFIGVSRVQVPMFTLEMLKRSEISGVKLLMSTYISEWGEVSQKEIEEYGYF